MKPLKYLTLLSASLLLAACSSEEANQQESAGEESQEVSIGVIGGVSAEIWEDVASRLAEDDIHLDVVSFSDYVQPNRALAEGELDLNAFQHVAFLTEHVTDTGAPIVPIGYTVISPMYIFSVEEIPNVESIPDGVSVAVPNSATTAERAFLGLQDIGLIELDDEAGYAPTVDDIIENYKDVEILELEPSQVPRALGDAELITIGGDMLADAGLNPDEAIYIDTEDNLDNIDPRKKNVIVSHEDHADSEVLQRIVEEYQSPETAQKIEEVSQGSSIPAWDPEGEDTAYEDFQHYLEELQ